jgi:hypothetical protein
MGFGDTLGGYDMSFPHSTRDGLPRARTESLHEVLSMYATSPN